MLLFRFIWTPKFYTLLCTCIGLHGVSENNRADARENLYTNHNMYSVTYNSVDESDQPEQSSVWPCGYKTFFMLNSAEPENFSPNKCENAYNS